MLSKIKVVCGNIFTSLKNWGARPANTTHWIPYVTALTIIANTIIHFSGHGWGFIVSDFLHKPLTVIGYQFTHPTFEHLFGNMLFLLLFGPAVERYFGHLKFLLFYLICGVASALGFALVYPNDGLVGASGAIAGVMAIYPFALHSWILRILAGCLAGTYFYLQFMASLQQLALPMFIETAHMAHVAGGVAGLILFAYWNRKD